MRLSSYLLSAQEILQQYKGDVPFAAWLKNFFREHKKYGSRDRKLITDLCFCFFRIGLAFLDRPLEERLLIGQFLCHQHSAFVQDVKPEWLEQSGFLLTEKIGYLDASQQQAIFPFADEVSPEIDLRAFQLSFLLQPDLFLRIRPGKEKEVIQKLKNANVAYLQEGACIRLPNSTKVDEILRIDEEAVIQDISSQRVLEPLQRQTPNSKPQTSLWDCCAASGGKTILFHDAYPEAKLTVSDIRESILVNLRNRLKRAGISSYQSFVADVSSPGFSLPQKFDVIICDAPCSGSGTWARTPEQLQFFKKERIEHYAALQKSIALNASKSLWQKGFFLYITCSVFRKENEEVVQYLQQNTGLQVLSQTYFKGYDKKGDTLFAALFTAS
jgi:16S rRNA (cytosine967-C5)-methyltransferase